ncbi:MULTISPECIES: hypothetical protein [Sphingobacterium]|uniref:hypothetical protein n=1 Tax=Sphingobacterium TaxID=28453 RepID=UPI0013DBE326|nr:MULTISPECIES: hypothetical protein [unclassified Sphingobacterium]
MSLSHSNTTFYLIKLIYNISIDKSNVLYILNQYQKIKELMLVDLDKGKDFTFEYEEIVSSTNENKDFFDAYFQEYKSTVDYNQLNELYNYITNQIERITYSVNLYKSYNKKITPHTKLYDVIDYINLHQQANNNLLDAKEVAQEIYNNLLDVKRITPKQTRLTPKQIIEKDILKNSIKKR